MGLQDAQKAKINKIIGNTRSKYLDPDVHVCLPSTCEEEDIRKIIFAAGQSKLLTGHLVL